MKQIPPPMQEDHRYLKFKVRGDDKKNIGEVVNAVWDSALNYMGTKGVSNADLWIIGNKFDRKNQEGVIKVNNSCKEDLRASLVLSNGFKDDSFLSIENVSGTLVNLEEQ